MANDKVICWLYSNTYPALQWHWMHNCTYLSLYWWFPQLSKQILLSSVQLVAMNFSFVMLQTVNGCERNELNVHWIRPGCFLYPWSLKAFLELKVILQWLHGMTIPSRWFASMWSLMAFAAPPFPHTLQMWALSFLLSIFFWLFSISDFTLSSSSSKMPGMANDMFSSGQWTLDICLLIEGFVSFVFVLMTFWGFRGRHFSSALKSSILL